MHGLDRESEFTFTGEACVEWSGSRVGEDCTVAGNILAGPEVVDAVVSTANVIEVNVNMAESDDEFPTFA